MALNASNEIYNADGGIVVEGAAVRGGYFVTDTLSDIPSYAQKEGQLCYCNEDNKFYQFKGGNWEAAAFGSDLNIEKGTGDGSNQTKDAIWNGGTQKDEENIIRVKDGDSVEGAIAEGFQSAAFGGKRYDKVRKNDEIDTSRKPTSAEGNQSFAAGASVHAHGDFSVAFGKDNDAHQRGGFVTGGGCRVGMTEEEFNAFYWDDVNNKPLNDGKGKNDDGKITDFENKSYEQSYSFGFTSGTINKALGRDSFATGLGTQALGRTSFASGQGTKALADYSFSSGCYSTIESGATASFASGSSNTIKGAKAFVAGESNTVEGTGSFAAGIGNTAGGYASVVLGRGLISNATGQFIAGQYNDENYLSSMAFAVGGGSNVDNVITRKNLLTLYKDGRLRLTQPTANLTDNDVTRLKDVKNLVTEATTEIDKKFEALDFEALDSDFFNSIY